MSRPLLIKLQEVFTPARPTNIIQTILSNDKRYQRYKVFIVSQNKVINMARHTREEIENSYVFKATKRTFKRKYPFIKELKLEDDWERYSTLLFVEVYFNPLELMEYLNIPQTESNLKYLNRWSDTSSAYLSMFFPTKANNNNVISNLSKDINDLAERIHESPALESDMVLPKKISISSWKVI
jgi:hypothetical protein